MKNTILRWLMRVGVLVLILGIPFTALGGFSLIQSGGVDAVSSATSYAFNPNDVSGEYVVLINDERHSDTIDVWTAFFQGENIPVVLDDISCMICKGDEGAKSYAEICQARLPENQMKIKSENSLLLMSKGEYGKFDIIILSKEIADMYAANSISKNNNITTVNIV